MCRLRSQSVCLLAACLCFLSFTAAYPARAQQQPPPHKKHKAAKLPVAPPTPDPISPPAPLTLQELPATPPQISYSKDELTVIAHNSTLGDVLRGIREKTGADLEVPGNASERVVGHFGPGAPRDVLSQLLDGSHFNYVILGSVTDPNKLERVVLSPKPPPAEQNAVQNAAPPPAPAADQSGFNQPPSDDDEDNADAQSDQANQPPAQSPVRTPEQLLQELQRQQQQQQQQEQQQGQPPGTTSAPAPHHQD